jgi:Na+/melibiose symporter-like transporter
MDNIHRAKVWQIGFFALNNVAVNLYYMLMMYMAYYAGGVLGFGVALVSMLLTAFGVFDGITDPIIGFIIDRTNTRFGKFRPFMILGNLIMAGDMALLWSCQYVGAGRLALLVVCFIIYDIGYTLQFDVTRAAQTVLTNDPKQRPLFSAFDMVYNVILYVGVSMFVSNYLVVRHGDFNSGMFGEFFPSIVLASAGCSIVAVLGIKAKDRPEYYGRAGKPLADGGDPAAAVHSPAAFAKPKLRDCLRVLARNRNVQMLMISAGTDKLFSNITTNSVVTVLVFGIVCGNYELSGQANMYVFAPSMVISLFCVGFARRRGQKSALLLATYGAIVANAALFLLFVLGEPSSLNFTSWGMFTIIFVAALALRGGFMSVGNSIIIPMIGDCADYEVYRTGKYIPGMIGGLFSFTDKIVTSLNSLIVGALVVSAGYSGAFPAVTTPYSADLFRVAMICFCGLPLLGWICNIIALRRYDLTPEKMAEIRAAAGMADSAEDSDAGDVTGAYSGAAK